MGSPARESSPGEPKEPPPADGPARRRRRMLLRLAGFAGGAALAGAAVSIALRERGSFAKALETVREASPLAVGGLLLAIAAGVVLTAALFHLLMRRYGAIPFAEMAAVIGAASFANYLPLKPGFAGRVAYHRVRHGIRAVDTLRAMIEAIALSGTTAAVILGGLFLLHELGIPAALALFGPALLAGVALPSRVRALALPLVLRQAEFALLALRYWLVFTLVGSPIGVEAALVLASANALASFVPFVAGGLGLREWITGLITPLVSPETFAAGVAAELVHRVAELAVVGPIGLGSAAYLARHVRRNPTPP